MKKILLILMTLSTSLGYSQPINDNCVNAINLVVDDPSVCGTTQNATLQGSECFTNYAGGSTEVSVWYRFNALNDSTILNFTKTNNSSCNGPHIRIYGPFSTSGGCLPTCVSAIYSQLLTVTNSSILLTGLSIINGNNSYLIQVQGNHCNGAGTTHHTFCLDVDNVTNPSLPVELISFDGIRTPNGNLLIWKTYTEYNSDYYLIEHSTNGEFDENSVIGRVGAAGNSSEVFAYTYTDSTPPQSINYYKLIQVDINGDYQEYGPISVDNRKLLKVIYLTDMLGRKVREDSKGFLFEIYEDGTTKMVFR